MNVTGLHLWSANVDPDLCRHMVSLGHNELNSIPVKSLTQEEGQGFREAGQQHTGAHAAHRLADLHFNIVLLSYV